MSQIQFERIWIAQCEAARRVKNRFGLANALDLLDRRETVELYPSCRAARRVYVRAGRFSPGNSCCVQSGRNQRICYTARAHKATQPVLA
jgi:hypothetical protein